MTASELARPPLNKAVVVAAGLNPARARIYMAMAMSANGDGVVAMTYDVLAFVTGLSPRSVRDHINGMERAGILEAVHTPRFRLIMPPDEGGEEENA